MSIIGAGRDVTRDLNGMTESAGITQRCDSNPLINHWHKPVSNLNSTRRFIVYAILCYKKASFLLQVANVPQTSVDFTNLFVRPPGDLLYYLAVIAISLAGFFMAAGQLWRRSNAAAPGSSDQGGFFAALGQLLRRPDARAPGRYSGAMLGIVAAWMLLLIGAMIALVAGQAADAILPPLERLVQVVTILL